MRLTAYFIFALENDFLVWSDSASDYHTDTAVDLTRKNCCVVECLFGNMLADSHVFAEENLNSKDPAMIAMISCGRINCALDRAPVPSFVLT